jgi:hypothetical protein
MRIPAFAYACEPARAVFWSRAVSDRIGGFDSSYKLIGDCEYWLRAARSGMELRHVREVIAVQVEHGHTLRQSHPELLRQEWATLRDACTGWAGRARPASVERLKTSSTWRANQLRFETAARRAARALGFPLSDD